MEAVGIIKAFEIRKDLAAHLRLRQEHTSVLQGEFRL
jgi:hypothetical protein